MGRKEKERQAVSLAEDRGTQPRRFPAHASRIQEIELCQANTTTLFFSARRAAVHLQRPSLAFALVCGQLRFKKNCAHRRQEFTRRVRRTSPWRGGRIQPRSASFRLIHPPGGPAGTPPLGVFIFFHLVSAFLGQKKISVPRGALPSCHQRSPSSPDSQLSGIDARLIRYEHLRNGG